jgi:hypothetical protein
MSNISIPGLGTYARAVCSRCGMTRGMITYQSRGQLEIEIFDEQ